MKTLLFAASFLLAVQSSYSQDFSEKYLRKLKDKVKIKHDEFEGVKWVRLKNIMSGSAKSSLVGSVVMKPYYGVFNDGDVRWRLEITVVDPDWVFCEKLMIKIDDEVHTVPLEEFQVETDVTSLSNGSAYLGTWCTEEYDVLVDMNLINLFADNPNGKWRITGKSSYIENDFNNNICKTFATLRDYYLAFEKN